MDKLKIYKEDSKFVIEHIDESDYATKLFFTTENDLLEAFDKYQSLMPDCELSIEQGQDLIGLITRHLVNKPLN